MHIQKHILMLYHILFLFYLLCMDVYMQANAWQRSCVRSPAIKKSPRGKARGGGAGSREEGVGRGRAAAEEASVFSQERGCRAK